VAAGGVSSGTVSHSGFFSLMPSPHPGLFLPGEKQVTEGVGAREEGHWEIRSVLVTNVTPSGFLSLLFGLRAKAIGTILYHLPSFSLAYRPRPGLCAPRPFSLTRAN
jgi:hypothetical protein